MDIHSRYTKLGSASQSSATATEQNDSSSSPQIDKADTNLSFYSTRNEGQIGETTTVIPALTPSPSHHSTTLVSEISTEQTYGTQVSVDELSENKAQLAYPPSDGTDASQLAPLVPVRRPSQSQPIDQAQSATTSSPGAQNTSTKVSHAPTPAPQGQLPSQYSPESYRVPTAQTLQTHPFRTSVNIPASSPRTSGESWDSDPSSSLTPQQHTTPLQQSAPTTPFIYSGMGMPSRPYGPSQSVATPKPDFSNPFIPPLPSYNIPNVPTPQASQSIYEGIHRQFVPQSAPTRSYSLPGAPRPRDQPIFPASPYSHPTAFSRYNSIAQATSPRKANVFVASDPFRVSHRNEKVDAPSDGLTFDDIPTAGSPRFTPQFHSLPNMPTPQAQSIHAGTPRQSIPQSVPSRFYRTSNAPNPQASQSIYAGTPQQFIPESTPFQFYNSPNAPTPQAQSIHTGKSQPSQMSGSFPNSPYVPLTPLYYTGYNPTSQAIKQQKTDSFVANDPFQMSYGGAKVDVPSNFDDISTARSSPELKFMQGIVTSPYGALPNRPTFGGYYPGSAPPAGAYGPSQISNQWGAYPTFNGSRSRPEIRRSRSRSADFAYANAPWTVPDVPPTQIPIDHSKPSWSWSAIPLPAVGSSPHRQPSLAQSHLPSTPHIQPKPPVPVSSPPVQSQAPVPVPEAPVYDEEEKEKQGEEERVSSPVPSIQSPIIAPNADDTVTSPAVPVNRPSSPSRSQDRPFTQHDPQTGASQSPGPYVFDPLYPPYPPFYPPYLQHPQSYQYPDLPKKSIFSRFIHFFGLGWSDHTHSLANPQPFTAIYPQPFTQPFTVIYPPIDPEIDWHKAAVKFMLVAFPKQIYLLFLLRLPSLYFSRVARIFEEADMSLPEIKKMVLETASQGLTHEFEIQMAFESPSVPPAYKRLSSTWESFIDSVMREWKTFNIISVLLLSAILSILQLGSAADDPLTRYTALFSLMCALISLLFGCMYIIRFGSMRKSYKAAEWAREAKRSKMLIWWNVWVLLAMPAIWLTWSIILYIACIMSFVWRSGVTSTTPPGLSDTGLLALRIVMTVVLGIGVLYGFLVITTFQRYGAVMDKEWKRRIDDWIEEKATGNKDSFAQPALDHLRYPPSHLSYPDRSAMYQHPTYNPPLRYRPSFGDVNGSYPRYVYAPHTYVPPPHMGSPHSTSDTSTTYRPGPNQPAPQRFSPWFPQPSPPHPTVVFPPTQVNTFPNNSSDLQGHDGMTSAASYNVQNAGATPPSLKFVATAEEFPPGFIPQRFIPDRTPRSLFPIPESPITPSEDKDNTLGFSSGLENRRSDSDDAPDHRNRVRFRLPSGSSDSSNQRKTHPS